MQAKTERDTHFIRKRALIWVCDVVESSNILNDPDCIDAAEEFLKRFHYISALLMRITGGMVTKWTGDGFLAVYDVKLDRNLGKEARKVFAAAWYLTLLMNITQLGVDCPKKFRIRHGVSLDADAILIEHKSDGIKNYDIIGRGVVLAFRLSGIKAKFPGIVTQKHLVNEAASHGSEYVFKKIKFSHEDLLKYFKGEKWSTNKIYASVDGKPKPATTPLVNQEEQKTTSKTNKQVDQKWLHLFCDELSKGPTWAKLIVKSLDAYIDGQ